MANDSAIDFDQVIVDQRLINYLYQQKILSAQARHVALDMLYPNNQWGVWIARVLLLVGCTLVLAGFISFFAFNWDKIPPMVKLYAIQFSVIFLIVMTYFFSIDHFLGKLSLLSASIFVGLFMAVFGQVYQTGADAYQLFMNWSLFIFVWTMISKFNIQWLLWLLVTNVFIVLWWLQTDMPQTEIGFSYICLYLSLLNGGVLVVKEVLSYRGAQWFDALWFRWLLVTVTLVVLALPILFFIVAYRSHVPILPTLIGCGGILSLFLFYRFRLKDIVSLALIIFTVTIIVEVKFVDLFINSNAFSSSGLWLIIGLFTMTLFILFVYYLRLVSAKYIKKNDLVVPKSNSINEG